MLDSGEAEELNVVRDHTEELIQDSCDADCPVLIEAPPNSGKTTSAIKLARQAEKSVTYLAGRIDLYEQAEEWCEDQDDIRYERIPAPHRTCDTFKGNTEVSPSVVERLYAKGYSGRYIHLRFPNKTPCGNSCEYFQAMKRIDEDIESIDFLIGHHSHCNRQQYVKNRIVIIDEFNPDPFLHTFPDETSNVIDDPGKIIPEFLTAAAESDTGFPADTYQDITDLLQRRDDPTEWTKAIEWFQEYKPTRFEAQQTEFVEPSLEQYNKAHTYAPFLTFGLLCTERIGPGIELAPPPDESLNDTWQAAGLGLATKCLRDRNTGEMYVLEPPDLSSAAQVIGLDGTPTVELWNLLFAPGTGFEHKQVISRDDFTTYLRSAMNMSLIQIGGGWHPYASGRISDLDEERLAAVQALEDEKFALVSTKKAIEEYRERQLLEQYAANTSLVDGVEEDRNRVSSQHKALHYALVKSSNDFESESLGVVAGMPHPGDDLVRLWAGFCGHAVEITEDEDEVENKSFGEFGDKIYHHFAHNQVIQAILRFGRDESVYENEGATVYISTYALPEWFDVSTAYNIRSKAKESTVLAALLEISHEEDQGSRAFRTVPQIYDAVQERDQYPSVSKRGVRNALERLSSKEYITVREDAGKHSADLYRWVGPGQLLRAKEGKQFLKASDDMYALPIEDELSIQS
jgi:hypothetical protein